MNPYPILAGLVLLIAIGFGGSHVGRKLEREKWQAKEIATATTIQKDLIAAHDKYVRLQSFNEAKARKASSDHEQAITTLTAQYDSARAAIRAAGGLRVSRAICADSHATAAQGAGSGRSDDASAANVELSDRTQSDLYALVKRADELAERLRALQSWVRASGGYGDAQDKDAK